MDRLFLDANVNFSAAYQSQSTLRSLWSLTDVVLITSDYALNEAQRNLGSGYESALASLISPMEIVLSPDDDLLNDADGPDLPTKDRPISRAARVSAATHLLTGDRRHFGKYFGQRFAEVMIMLPADYLHSRNALETAI